MRLRPSIALPALAVAAALVLSACGGETATTPPPATNGGDDHEMLEVTVREFSFTPDEMRVKAGEEVMLVLENAGTLEHDFAIDDPEVLVYAGVGETVTEMIGSFEAGEYTVYCSIPGHREAGMEATLTAEE